MSQAAGGRRDRRGDASHTARRRSGAGSTPITVRGLLIRIMTGEPGTTS